MRNDLIELLALLVSVGYIKSFRVTKTYSTSTYTRKIVLLPRFG